MKKSAHQSHSKIKILLVDDHALVRAGLKSVLESQPDFAVVKEAASGEEALKLVREQLPDIAIMDIKMPGVGGLEAAKRLLHAHPSIRVIILSACTSDPYPSKFMQVGVHGFVAKDAPADELILAVRKVMQGGRYVCGKIAQNMALTNLTSKKSKKNNPESASQLSSISDREMQVLIMIAKGLTADEIAQKLCVTVKSVNSYRYRLYQKLNVKTDVLLTHVALLHGLVNLGENTY